MNRIANENAKLSEDMLQAALSYAEDGWRLIPDGRDKIPLIRDWPNKASSDPDIIRKWWVRWPHANIGLLMGDGFFVLDVDNKDGRAGESDLREMESRYGALPKTRVVETPSGGQHYYFKTQAPIMCSRGVLPMSFDIRGEGGQILAPPSVFGGKPYEYREEFVDIVYAPEWLEKLILSKVPMEHRNGEDSILKGERNSRLFALGRSMRWKGFSPKAIRVALEKENETRCVPPFREREIEQLLTSIQRGDAPPAQGAINRVADSKELPPLPTPVDIESYGNGVPEAEWTIPSWLLKQSDLVITSGGPYTGKSTTAFNLAHAVSTGTPWLGIEVTGEHRVIIFDEEQGERSSVRLLLRFGKSNKNIRMYSSCGFCAGTPDGAGLLERAIEDFGAELVIFDSWSHLMRGCRDENDATEVGRVFQVLHRLREKLRVSFWIIDHRPKQNNRFGTPGPNDQLDSILRGSTMKAAQALAVYGVYRIDEGQIEVRQLKRREADKLTAIRIGREVTPEGNIVLSSFGEPLDVLGAEQNAAAWILQYLTEVGAGRHKDIMTAGKEAGHKEKTLGRALKREWKAGRLEHEPKGMYAIAPTAKVAQKSAEGLAEETVSL